MSRCHSFPPPGYQIPYEAIFDLLKEIKKDVEKERKKRKNLERKLKKMKTRETGNKTRFHKKRRIEEDPKPISKLEDDSTVENEQTSSQISSSSLDNTQIQKQSNHFHGNGVFDKLSTSSSQESNESTLLCSNYPHSDAIPFTNLIENWIPNKIQRMLSEFEDLEWVVKKQNSQKFSANKDEISNHITSYERCSSIWPIACYLPEAKVLALPFTVPF